MNLLEKYNFYQTQLGNTKLVAVSKTKPIETLLEAYNIGFKVFGENKVQELVEKQQELPKDIEWHMIGHLQTNKVKYIISFVHLIHSIDSEKLLQEVQKQAQKIGKVQNCLLQIHIAEEDTKFGFSFEEAKKLLLSEQLGEWQNIKIVGLMGMATFTEDTIQIRKEFKNLKQFLEEMKPHKTQNVDLQELSIGMSGDYELGIQEGSTIVRIGSAIFGNR
jgi:PLP dependent protein